MSLRNFIYFMITSLIWGSTWYVIKFQVGSTDPLVSVSYRFLIAGLILLLYAIISKQNLKISTKGHLFILLQGVCLFGFNYWLVYMAEVHLTSALVAVVFSTLTFMNIFFNWLILKAPIRKEIVVAAIIGFFGVVFLFKNEITLDLSDHNFVSLLMAVLSVVFASFGSILSVVNLKRNISLIQSTSFGMIYGALSMLIIAVFMGKSLNFEMTVPYVTSLFYLAIIGSVAGFSLYLKIQSEIGPDKAGYIAMLIPVIALITSTIFEGYIWTPINFTGALLIVLGNGLAILSKRKMSKAVLQSEAEIR